NTQKNSKIIFYLENSHKIPNNTKFLENPPIPHQKFPTTCNIQVILTTRNEAEMVVSYFDDNPDVLKEQIPTIVTIQSEYSGFAWDIPGFAYYFVPIRAIIAHINSSCIKNHHEKNSCIPVKWTSYCHWCTTQFKTFSGRDDNISILKMLKYWKFIHVKDRSPLFQITYGGFEQSCQEGNHINLDCEVISRYW